MGETMLCEKRIDATIVYAVNDEDDWKLRG